MRHIKMSFWDKKEAKRFFQKLRFYNALIENHVLNLLGI